MAVVDFVLDKVKFSEM